ncbi:MAG TPA: SRPBCC domain-containing protein [Chitinophagaceae bacterium]|jgi:uncharacterized protein YndB with AHSA1/START domain|nr:SRPBCC domain-containing protein [Chitinophagaceae bacterium]
MIYLSIEKTIKINVPVEKAWDIFTNPVITRQLGGEYISEWKAGSSINWQVTNGKIYTNGIILAIESGKILKHSQLDMNDSSKLISVITYRFTEEGQCTILDAKEELNYEMTAEQFKDVSKGWDLALKAVKEVAEKMEPI